MHTLVSIKYQRSQNEGKGGGCAHLPLVYHNNNWFFFLDNLGHCAFMIRNFTTFLF
jgi:hypothetical protein